MMMKKKKKPKTKQKWNLIWIRGKFGKIPITLLNVEGNNDQFAFSLSGKPKPMKKEKENENRKWFSHLNCECETNLYFNSDVF